MSGSDFGQNQIKKFDSVNDDYDDDDSEDGELIDNDDHIDRRRSNAAAGPQTPPEPHQMILGNESDDGQEDALTIKPPQAQTHKERAERVKERTERRERRIERKSGRNKSSGSTHRSKDRRRMRSASSNTRSSNRTSHNSGQIDRRGGNSRERRHKEIINKEPSDMIVSMGRRSGRANDDDLSLAKDNVVNTNTNKDRLDRPRNREERERERLERVESEKRRDRLIYAERERERQRERQKREMEARRQHDLFELHARDRSPIEPDRKRNVDRDSSTRTKKSPPRMDTESNVHEHERVVTIDDDEEHLIIGTSDHEDEIEEILESDGEAIVVEELSEQSTGEFADEEIGEDRERDYDNDDAVNGESEMSSDGQESSDKTEEGRSGSEASTPQSRDENSDDEQNGDEDDDDDDEDDNDDEEEDDDNDDEDSGSKTTVKDENVQGTDMDNATAVYLMEDSPPPLKPEPQLPSYLPAIQGCRNVEEFDCLNRIEEGTYGVVYRARHKKTQEIVALKRLKMEKERDGFPITSLREINTLLKAQHPNIVTVREIVVGSNMDKIYIVMDYVEHDLKSLMETMRQPFLIGEVKTLMIQLLRAVAHLHDNWILHRDLKTSNLLLSHKGVLKVGDFGLAREYGSPLKHYTPVVVTLWYRAPELLLGSKDYSTPIDVWSVGCIFGELLTMKPLFPGKSDINQLNCIFKDMGTPNEQIWPGYSELPMVKRVTFADIPYSNLRRRFEPTFTNCGMDLLNKLLYFDPKRRVSAEEALKHKYFSESPKPVEPSLFPTWPAKSELSAHVRTQQSPKPPSGGKQYAKQLGNDDDDIACAGFHMGEPQDTIIPRAGEMFRLRF